MPELIHDKQHFLSTLSGGLSAVGVCILLLIWPIPALRPLAFVLAFAVGSSLACTLSFAVRKRCS